MHILFVTAALNTKNDGIYDAILEFARIEILAGNQVSFLGMSDYQLQTRTIKESIFELDGYQVRQLHIPTNVTLYKRSSCIQKWIQSIGITHVELHYCPHIFHAKGLPFIANWDMIQAFKGVVRRVYVHEMMVGFRKIHAPFSRMLQRIFLSYFKPAHLYTHSSYFYNVMCKWGLPCEKKPLPTTVPCIYPQKTVWQKMKDQQALVCVVFGRLRYAGAPVSEFAKEFCSIASTLGVSPKIVFAGYQANDAISNYWVQNFKTAGVIVEIKGPLEKNELSYVFSNAHIGIVNTPYGLSEKSSALACLQAHNLPSFCLAPNIGSESWNLPWFDYRVGSCKQIMLDMFAN